MTANGMHPLDLAWALADATDHCLDPPERGRVYVTLGAGDTDQAIRALSACVIRARIALPTPVAATLASWWRINGVDERTSALIAALPTAPALADRPACATLTPQRKRRPHAGSIPPPA